MMMIWGVDTVLEVHFDSWTIGSFAHPDIQILALARLEEEYIIAVVQLRQLVQLVEFGFRVELSVFAAMGEERVEVIEKVTMSDIMGSAD